MSKMAYDLDLSANTVAVADGKGEDIGSALRVSADCLATQLTLIHAPVFAAIRPTELLSCGWNGSAKLQVAPNVVDFTQRFNRVSFWAVQEILSHKSVKQRAEAVSHFVKVAKRLVDLNNLHFAFAVVSALTSAPIHRLTKTWAYLSKKDKQSLDRLNELFSESDNFEKLRDHLSGAKTPCVPYLGMYLHDIVYIDIAHPSTHGLDNPLRRIKLDNILRIISEFQRSSYDHLPILPNVQKYLSSIRYIEELQKFLEDYNFKLSLKLEPPESSDSRQSVFYVRESSSASLKSMVECTTTLVRSPSMCQTPNYLTVNYYDNGVYASAQANSMPGFSKKYINFIPGHRKARSLGTNVLSSISSMTSTQQCAQLSTLISPLNIAQNAKNRCLIDDSVIADEHLLVNNCDNNLKTATLPPTFEIIRDDDDDEDAREESVVVEEDVPLKCYREINSFVVDHHIVHQGSVKRKTVMKDGKKPSMCKAWVRYWLVLQGTHLLFFDTKQMKNCHRYYYPSNPVKILSLSDCVVALVENSSQADTFTISDSTGSNIYKFRTQSAAEAFEWYKRISQVLAQFQPSRNNSLIECLIDFN